MSAGGDYTRPHIIRQSCSTRLDFLFTDGTKTLIPGKTNYKIRVQRIVVMISASAAQSITFQDAAGLYVCKIPASPGVDTRWDFDFTPGGKELGDAQGLVMAMTAGNAGHVEVEAFYMPDAVMVYGNSN